MQGGQLQRETRRDRGRGVLYITLCMCLESKRNKGLGVLQMDIKMEAIS